MRVKKIISKWIGKPNYHEVKKASRELIEKRMSKKISERLVKVMGEKQDA